MRQELVTRAKLAEWGFRRMPDTWIPCPVEGRRQYFERWYQAAWNFSALVGYPERDVLQTTEEDFVAQVQGYLLEPPGSLGRWPWDEAPQVEEALRLQNGGLLKNLED